MLFIKYRNRFLDMTTREEEPPTDKWSLHEVGEREAKLIEDGTGIYQGTLDERVRTYCRVYNISMGYSECWAGFDYELYTEKNLPAEYRTQLITKEAEKLKSCHDRIKALAG